MFKRKNENIYVRKKRNVLLCGVYTNSFPAVGTESYRIEFFVFGVKPNVSRYLRSRTGLDRITPKRLLSTNICGPKL